MYILAETNPDMPLYPDILMTQTLIIHQFNCDYNNINITVIKYRLIVTV